MSALVASSASAEACQKKAGSKHYVLCIEGEKIAEGTNVHYTQHQKLGYPPALLYLYGKTYEVKCEVITSPEINGFFGWHEGAVRMENFAIGMHACSVEEQGRKLKCETVKTWNFPVGGPVRFEPSADIVTIYGGTEPEHLGTISFSGEGCGPELSGAQSLKGNPKCTFTETEVEQVAHELVCKESSMHVWSAGASFTIKGSLLELTSTYKSKKYSIVEG
jgi:hypothetical protein